MAFLNILLCWVLSLAIARSFYVFVILFPVIYLIGLSLMFFLFTFLTPIFLLPFYFHLIIFALDFTVVSINKNITWTSSSSRSSNLVLFLITVTKLGKIFSWGWGGCCLLVTAILFFLLRFFFSLYTSYRFQKFIKLFFLKSLLKTGTLLFSLSVSLSVFISVSVSVCLFVSLSLSLYIYIYI